MADQMWRFPDNNYTSENGLDTSDMEMFKRPCFFFSKRNLPKFYRCCFW